MAAIGLVPWTVARLLFDAASEIYGPKPSVAEPSHLAPLDTKESCFSSSPGLRQSVIESHNPDAEQGYDELGEWDVHAMGMYVWK